MKDQCIIVLCPDCLGDGVETCHNPDHGFFYLISSAGYSANKSACPCCGHNPTHKMKGICDTCAGTGKVSMQKYDAYIDEFVDNSYIIDELNKICIENYFLNLKNSVSFKIP